MATPNTENYTLGKGILYFNRRLSDGSYLGERDLGNSPEMTVSISVEKLDHFSSRGGLKAKDKSIISEISPTLSFTLDEFDAENIAMLFMGSVNEVSQQASYVTDEAITVPKKDRFYSLANKFVGHYYLDLSDISGTFQVGETVTGGTSNATAVVVAVMPTRLYVKSVSGTFQQGETVTGGTSNATADVDSNGAQFQLGFVIVKNQAGSTTYTYGTDYRVGDGSSDGMVRDGKLGRLYIMPGSTITEGSIVKVSYAVQAATFKQVRMLETTSFEGQLRFVSDNPEGPNYELMIWNVSIAPEGDTGLISDEWATMSFTGEILKDEVGHPDSPYATVTLLS